MNLVDFIRRDSSPLLPRSTGDSPRLPTISGIRYVVFDIYGTIIISAAGDISLAGGTASPGKAMERVWEELGLTGDGAGALPQFEEAIGVDQERRRQKGVEFPEVEIREIWARLLDSWGGDPARAEEASVIFECTANPVWPMPGMRECLEGLRSRDLGLGIVSNAQFYTRLLFPAFLDASLEELGFDPDAMVFSYEEGEGKPSRNLFAKLSSNLRKKGVRPEEVLYIGNDRLKDIWPAGLEGLKTVFFAGDERSHRWREDDPRLQDVVPDAVVTSLDQIAELIECES